MCQSMAEGGQRCASHTRPRYEAAKFGTSEWDEAAADHASTRRGRRAMEREMETASMERQVALATAIKRGEAKAEAAAQIRAEVQAAASGFPPPSAPPRIEDIQVEKRGSTWALVDGKGRAFSTDGSKVFEFSTTRNAEDWKAIAARKALFERWITA